MSVRVDGTTAAGVGRPLPPCALGARFASVRCACAAAPVRVFIILRHDVLAILRSSEVKQGEGLLACTCVTSCRQGTEEKGRGVECESESQTRAGGSSTRESGKKEFNVTLTFVTQVQKKYRSVKRALAS